MAGIIETITNWWNGVYRWFSPKFSQKLKDLQIFEKAIASNFGESSVYYYPIRSDKQVDIRESLRCLGQTEALLKGVVNTIILKDDDMDTKVEKIRDFVNTRLTYRADDLTYFRSEYWADPYTVYDKKTDDCDGYAILIMTLMRLAGIPAWRRRIVAGKVSSGEGHAYVVYFTESNNMWCVVEGSYYAPDAKKKFNVQPYVNNNKYLDVWFTFNEELAWANGKKVFVNELQ